MISITHHYVKVQKFTENMFHQQIILPLIYVYQLRNIDKISKIMDNY
jgi:hypothetical protein